MKTFIWSGFLVCIMMLFTTHVFSQNTYENEKYLLVLDVQQCWTEKSLSEKAADDMIKFINTLIEKTDPAKVIYVNSFARIASLTFKGVRIDTLPNQGFDKRLNIVNNRVYIKAEGDAFTSKDLITFLNQNQAKEIIITGLLAEQCVTKTVLGGINRNYSMYIVTDALGAKSEKSKNKVVQKLTKAGAKVLL